MNHQTRIINLSGIWKIVGPTMWLIAAAYPFLVTFVELRELTLHDILPPFGVALLGCWFSFEASRRAVVNDEGVSFETSFGKRWVAWADFVGVELVRSNFVFRDRFGVRHVVSVHASKVEDLVEAVRHRCTSGA